MLHPTEVGQRVHYARDWLRNTGQFTGEPAPTSWGPFAAGEVVKLDKGGPWLTEVRWDDGEATRVLNVNLVREDKIHLEAR
jgi:hypothetical protein